MAAFERVTGVMCGVCLVCAGCGSFDLSVPEVGPRFEVAASDVVTRYFHRASLLHDGRVMVSGGLTARVLPPALVPLDTIAFFDADANTFTTAYVAGDAMPASVEPRLHIARSSHTQTTLLDGRVLICGGNTTAANNQPGGPTETCELFDAETGAISLGPGMSEARAFHTATLLSDDRVVVAGGMTWQVFDPAGESWSPPAMMARPRVRHAAVHLPGHFAGDETGGEAVLLIGGVSGGDALELLDVDAMTSTLLPVRLPVAVFDLNAVRLESGLVLIAGGQRVSDGDTMAQVLLLDPQSGELSELAAPDEWTQGLGDHAMLQFGSRVVIFGGERESGDVDTELDTALVFDAERMSWTHRLRMNFPHDDFAAVKLDDGRAALIGGGVGLFGVEVPTAHVEIFTAEFGP